MADKRAGNKLPNWASRESTPGIRVDSGPHLGIVKNNSDPARLGRLQVLIPDLGGEETEPSNWYTISYATPYFGSTQGLPGAEDATRYGYEQQTYGFWAVPPDIGNFVLVTFIMGDPSRGYWFACIPNTPVAHMIPGISRAVNSDKTLTEDPAIKGRVSVSTDYLPVTELNTNNKQRDNDPNFLTAPKTAHIFQANVVLEQGLEKDPVRGTITSSAQRETPSQVFGLSTPGRTFPDTAVDFPNLDELLQSGQLPIYTLQSFPARKGGHTFVMDDGDIKGNDNLVRLRTAGGHTILMNDTEDLFYIINKTGNAWVELTKNGSINLYGHEDLNIRTRRDLNIHADANVNIHSGDTLKFYAEKNIKVQTQTYQTTALKDFQLNAGKVGVLSTTALSLQSVTGGWKSTGDITLKGRKIYFNTGEPALPSKNPQFEFYQQPTVEFDNTNKKWKVATSKFESISPFTPTHEPWARATGELKLINGKVVASMPQTPIKKS